MKLFCSLNRSGLRLFGKDQLCHGAQRASKCSPRSSWLSTVSLSPSHARWPGNRGQGFLAGPPVMRSAWGWCVDRITGPGARMSGYLCRLHHGTASCVRVRSLTQGLIGRAGIRSACQRRKQRSRELLPAPHDALVRRKSTA